MTTNNSVESHLKFQSVEVVKSMFKIIKPKIVIKNLNTIPPPWFQEINQLPSKLFKHL